MSKWPEGPWNDEPDELEFTTMVGLTGRIKRTDMGCLCGYVHVPVEMVNFAAENADIEEMFDVHGGVTWDEVHEGFRVIGFDCAHCDDLVPSMMEYGVSHRIYRTFEYVKQEVESLAQQIVTHYKKELYK